MKKALLLIFIASTFNLVNAQEKQNDATWEETIGFIRKYFKSITRTKLYIWSSGDNTCKMKSVGSYINSNQLFFRCTNSDNDFEIHIPLDKLNYVGIEPAGVYIGVVGNDIWWRGIKHSSGRNPWKDKRRIKRLILSVPNNEIEPRMVKAFKHLTYLAKQKRDLKRKQSGEKF